jgi:protein TonB
MKKILNWCKLVLEGKGVNLTSPDWCDLVFEGKNKEYGAYELRLYSNKRHLVALISVLTVAVFLFFLPSLIQLVTPKGGTITTTEANELVVIKEVEVEEQKIEPELPPPPVLKSSFKLTDPVIVSEVPPEEEQKTIQELLEGDAVISVVDVVGDDDDPNAQLIVDVQQISDEKTYDIVNVEQLPGFPGGDKAMREFISKNLNYPSTAAEGGIEGKVLIRFVISKTGEVTEVTVIRAVHALLDKEAVRVIQKMPNWSPGRNNGNPVKVAYTVPVVFKLANK